ncbi:MAG TPA: hypothetical protein VGR45_14475 [Stellaceae bacterium]|nr:hypothetical protein [Stellaceae bacterium]
MFGEDQQREVKLPAGTPVSPAGFASGFAKSTTAIVIVSHSDERQKNQSEREGSERRGLIYGRDNDILKVQKLLIIREPTARYKIKVGYRADYPDESFSHTVDGGILPINGYVVTRH